MKRPTHAPIDQARHLRSLAPLLASLGELRADIDAVMAEMEAGYETVAGHHGFACSGCEESCCRTRFYHHTYAEFLLLAEGLDTLTADALRGIYARAAPKAGDPPRRMCPLNLGGRCMLYAYRPMICRLHGIPHSLRRPDGRVLNGPGCHRFDACIEGQSAGGRRLDRTPYYQRLAAVEQALRGRIAAPIRLHLTLAEWLWARSRLEGD